MTNSERKKINQSLKLLRKDWPNNRKCKQYVFGCCSCLVYRLLEDMDSFVNYWSSTDE